MLNNVFKCSQGDYEDTGMYTAWGHDAEKGEGIFSKKYLTDLPLESQTPPLFIHNL